MKEIQFKSTIDVNLIQSMGGDHMIFCAAKVSTNGMDVLNIHNALKSSLTLNPTQEQRVLLGLKDDQTPAVAVSGLINYLIKHRHGTPFEHSCLTFFVHAPILVWREWHRHRIGMSYNEESGRYKELEPVFYLPDRNRPMMKVDNWKPGRPKFLHCDNDDTFNCLCTNLKHAYTVSYEAYINNLGLGIDPGLARDCLPVGIYSGCWVTCNPRSLMAFLSLRVHEPKATFPSYPLWEIDVAARACEDVLKIGWPLTHKAFIENGRVAP